MTNPHSKLPIDHPVLTYRPKHHELKTFKSVCPLSQTQCNAYAFFFSPLCGLTPISSLPHCPHHISKPKWYLQQTQSQKRRL